MISVVPVLANYLSCNTYVNGLLDKFCARAIQRDLKSIEGVLVCFTLSGDVLPAVWRSFRWQLMRSSTKSGAFLIVKVVCFINSHVGGIWDVFRWKGFGDASYAAAEVLKWRDKKTLCPNESWGEHSQLTWISKTVKRSLFVKTLMLSVAFALTDSIKLFLLMTWRAWLHV